MIVLLILCAHKAHEEAEEWSGMVLPDRGSSRASIHMRFVATEFSRLSLSSFNQSWF